jgi:hypothetical protein
MKIVYLCCEQKKSWRGEAGTPASSQKEKFINLLFNKAQLSVQRKGYTKDQSKYKIISPEDLLANIDYNKYAGLKEYLRERYWEFK